MILRLQLESTSANALLVEDLVASAGLEVQFVEKDESRARITGAEVLIVILIVMATATAIEHVVGVVQRVRAQFAPLTILDLTSDEPKLIMIEDAPGRQGQLLAKLRDGDEVIDLSDKGPVEMAEVFKAVLPSNDS